ncbi:SRPBCC family protein [Brevibacterium yomogidense]|uniref:SRPBCC family protein n=1 Tax=Brevibacterium yomogidense TaxID=946573 RepID=UPI0018DF28CE
MSADHTHVVPRPGESAPFHFATHWHFSQPSARVWEVFQNIGRWHEWWPGVRDSTTLNGAARAGSQGARAALRVHRPLVRDLRLILTVTRATPPVAARVDVAGDLRGHGHWHAVEDGTGCRVEIVWCVVTRSRIAKAARGASAWTHRRVMDGGLHGLRRRLEESAVREE